MKTTDSPHTDSNSSESTFGWTDVYPTLAFHTAYVVPSVLERAIEATILLLICIVALTGNISLWYIVCSNRSLRNTSNALVLCLSTADILVSAINMPITIYTIALGRWPLTDRACVVFGFISMVTFIASVMSLGVISINRYYMICQPNRFRRLYIKRNTAFFIIGTWVLSIGLATPPLFGWGRYGYLPNQSFCFADWKTSVSYTFFMVGTCFGGPCSVMSVCYFMIMRSIRASRRRIASHNDKEKDIVNKTAGEVRSEKETRTANMSKKIYVIPESVSADTTGALKRTGCNFENVATNRSAVPSKEKLSSRISPKRQEKPKIKKVFSRRRVKISQPQMLNKATLSSPATIKALKAEKNRRQNVRLAISFLVVIFVFVLCWLPFCVTMFLSVFSKRPIPRGPDIFTLLLGCFNSLCNPIIYGVMNTRFRSGFRKIYITPCRGICTRPFQSGRLDIAGDTFTETAT